MRTACCCSYNKAQLTIVTSHSQTLTKGLCPDTYQLLHEHQRIHQQHHTTQVVMWLHSAVPSRPTLQHTPQHTTPTATSPAAGTVPQLRQLQMQCKPTRSSRCLRWPCIAIMLMETTLWQPLWPSPTHSRVPAHTSNISCSCLQRSCLHTILADLLCVYIIFGAGGVAHRSMTVAAVCSLWKHLYRQLRLTH